MFPAKSELSTLFVNYFSTDPLLAETSANEISEIPATEEVIVEFCQILLQFSSDTAVHKLVLTKFYQISDLIIKNMSEEALGIVKSTIIQIYQTETEYEFVNKCVTLIEYILLTSHASWPELDQFMFSPESSKYLKLLILKEYLECIATPETGMQFFNENFSGMINEIFEMDNRNLFSACLTFMFNYGTQSLKDFDAFDSYKDAIIETLIKYAPTYKTRRESASFFTMFIYPKYCHYIPSFDTFIEINFFEYLTTLEAKEEFMLMMISIIKNNREIIADELIAQIIDPILTMRKEMIEKGVETIMTSDNFSLVLSVINETDAAGIFETLAADEMLPGREITLFFIESYLINNPCFTLFDEYLLTLISSDTETFIESTSIYSRFVSFKGLSNEDLAKQFFEILSVTESLEEDDPSDNRNDNFLSEIINDLKNFNVVLDATGLMSILEAIAMMIQKGFVRSTYLSLEMFNILLFNGNRPVEDVTQLVQPITEIISAVFEIEDIYMHSNAAFLISGVVLFVPSIYEEVIPHTIGILLQDITAEGTDMFGIVLSALLSTINSTVRLKESAESQGQPFEVYNSTLSSVFEQIPVLMEKSELDINMTQYVANDGLKRLRFFLSVSNYMQDNEELLNYILSMLVSLLGVGAIGIDPEIIRLTEEVLNYASFLQFNTEEYQKDILTSLSYRAKCNTQSTWYVFPILRILEKENSQPFAFCEETDSNLIVCALEVIDANIRENAYNSYNNTYEIVKYLVNTIYYDSFPVEYLESVIAWIENSICHPETYVVNISLILLGAVLARGQGMNLIEGAIPIALQMTHETAFDGGIVFFISLLCNVEEISQEVIQQVRDVCVEKLQGIDNNDSSLTSIKEELIAVCIKLAGRGVIDANSIIGAITSSVFVVFSVYSRDIIFGFLIERFSEIEEGNVFRAVILKYFSFFIIRNSYVKIDIDGNLHRTILTILANEYRATGSLDFSQNPMESEKLRETLDEFIAEESKEE